MKKKKSNCACGCHRQDKEAFVQICGHCNKKSFFDYTTKEKKKIMKEAAKESNKEQRDLASEWQRAFGTTDEEELTTP